ncbi:MAG: TonB-dependent receptor [Flavobacteriaceae bacterium]|nr:TonB-dependent receptor [Flavobacteriaceae bacterium]
MKSLFQFVVLLGAISCLQAQEKQPKDTILGKKVVLDEVLVSAVRVQSDAPITHSNVSKATIAKRNLGQDIPILLNYLPAVVTTSDAGAGVGYTGIRVRGSDATRVNVTINGIAYNDAESMGTFWVNLPDFASNVESIQLQRGVGTSTNGAGAFGASLNVLTNAVSKEAKGKIANSFGSFNTRKHTVQYSTGLINNHVEISGSLSKVDSDGYIDRAFSDLKSYFLQGAYVNKNTLIKAIVFGGKEQTYQAWAGIDATQLKENRRQNPYTYENETDNYQQDHHQLHWNQKHGENWSTNLSLNYTKGKGYFEQYRADKDATDFGGVVLATDGDKTDAIVRRWLDNDLYVVNANLNYKTAALDVLGGFSYSNYTGDHFGEVIWAKAFAPDASIRDRYYFSDATKTDFSMFAKANFKLSKQLEAFVDLQGRFVGYQTQGTTSDRVAIDVDDTFSFFNPKAGLTYHLNSRNDLYFSYARAHREPNRDNYENGAVKPEKLNDFELGWRTKGKNHLINANLYYMGYTDQLVLTGALSDTGSPLAENVGKSHRIGIEIDAYVRFNDYVSIRPNIALSSNKNKDYFAQEDGSLKDFGNTNIAFSPNVVVGNTIGITPFEGFEAGLHSKYVGEQYMGNLDKASSKLSSYFVNDLSLNYTIPFHKVLDNIVLQGMVNNIFNKLYESNGYFYSYDDTWSNPGATNTIYATGYYPQAGTNFLVGIQCNF